MKVTVLMENTAPEGCGLTAEAGLSLYIEYAGRKLLLDAGSSGKFAGNAQALGVDLGEVELAVLSHGHFDHADGLRQFFQLNSRAPAYMGRGAGGPYYSFKNQHDYYFIGIRRDIWREYRDRFVETEGLYALGEGVWLAPDTVHDPEFTGRAADLLFKRGEDDLIPDDFRHERSLVLEEERGLALFNSCSHSGIVNIVRGVQEQFPGRNIFAVVGGFHMFGKGEHEMNCSPEYVRRVAAALKELGVEQVHTGHCTGPAALALLQETFGPGLRPLTTGEVLTL
ncbi:MBL fold metallo-hydrolase [Pseudoflavonifractor sp. 60]|uniref:MBL fold metallo-hydrolase n=1 Tax=Pseudoflavonifractor sp. 60 TaxID=2304576 RepID=UPI00137132E6|nr:MBL fold metallo-hydrolase [Pseudoflavonifractor sp. 60]NBI68540.1 MBL fold metallo-hydrolase [Pseudoflavonifractor sp. 60]